MPKTSPKNKKIKLLIANDAHYLGTGYGVYGKELLTRLNESGRYEVAEIGCYADPNVLKTKEFKWKFYPAIPAKENEEQFKAYQSNIVNQFGAFVFSRVLLDFQPDIVFDVRDYWMYSYQETHPYRPFYKWVVMPTVDSSPQKEDWLHTFANMDLVVPYTEWAKKTLSKQCGNNINLFPKIVNAGFNPVDFYPIPDKKEYQKSVFGKEVKITGLVMRNQKRKLFPDILQVYRKFLNILLKENKEEYDKHYLYMHTSFPEEHGWNIGDLLLENELCDKVYFTYICSKCKASYASKFHNGVSRCKECGTIAATMPNASNPVSTEKLNKVYNLFDFFVQYAICEGFGMPQVEAAACGIPLASVEYSAMSEIVRNLKGYPVPVQRLFRELETGADRAYPDNDKMVDILYDFFVKKNDAQRFDMSCETSRLCKSTYTWDQTYKVWDECFQSVDLSDKEPWNAPIRNTQHGSISVPANLNPNSFVEYICNVIINDPYLLKTSPIQTLSRNFSNKIHVGGGKRIAYSYENVTKILENYLNNKIVHEKMRIEKINGQTN